MEAVTTGLEQSKEAEQKQPEAAGQSTPFEWHDAKRDNPKVPRDYLVHVGFSDRYGTKCGFITISNWTGRFWEVFGLLNEETIPHITHWIEWMPEQPGEYIKEK